MTTPVKRNPGPSWGFSFLLWCDRLLPEFVYRPIRALATVVAVCVMPEQRKHSRAYLEIILNRPPSAFDLWRHFFAFEEMLMTKLRVANGLNYQCDFSSESENNDFRDWLQTGGAMFLGTFHVGTSDLLGFQLGGAERRRIHLVRHQVGNSKDTEELAARYGKWVNFIWVNDPSQLLFALKDTAALPDSVIALQCDRVEFSARTEAFHFLGKLRQFPFTIYHLALIFNRPILFSVGIPIDSTRSTLHASPRFDPLPGESKAAALARARIHFQDFLTRLESLLRKNPYLWFNYIPLNPEITS